MRTYSGHSTARASNELYRTNLAKGQTGLSIAFDLPTQTGYDPDAPEAAGEVGKVGVPVAHLGHMGELLDGIPVAEMNTSMTINATAAWLLGLYVAHAEDQGVDPALLAGTTQNDIVKEYLSRGTYIFPPGPSLRLTVDTIAYTVRHVPKWNPINVCSYHLQEAGATPVQEIAYALATAIGVLDGVRASGKIDADRAARRGRAHQLLRELERPLRRGDLQDAGLHRAVGPDLPERYGVEDPKLRRFRYGVQVNSLGLTEQQPENNVQRIVLEIARRHACPRTPGPAPCSCRPGTRRSACPGPWDQQWSLRIQQVLAFESDLLEYDDIFEGSKVDRGQDGRAGRRRRRPSWPTWRRSVAPSRPSTSSSAAWCAARPSGCGASRSGEQTGRRRQLLHRDRAVAAAGRRRVENILKVDHRSRPSRSPTWSAGGPSATTRAVRDGARRRCGGWPRTTGPAATSWRRRSPWRTPAAPPGSGPARCARCSASSGRPTGVGGGVGPPRRRAGAESVRPAPRRWPSAPAGRPASSWPSPVSTGTPTGPSRSPWRPATPASR